jgi:hypothetical protein
MFVIPDLSKTAFNQVDVEITSELHDFPPDVAKKLEGEFPGEPFSFGGGCKTFEKPCVMTLRIDGTGTDLTIKLGIQMDWVAEAQVQGTLHHQGTRLKPDDALTAGDFGSVIHGKLSVLYGLRLFVGRSECVFRVNTDDLPPGGIISRGVGARAQFGDDTLRLAGAQFAINGENWHRLNWSVEPEDSDPDWRLIQGSVSWIGEGEMGPTLLNDIVDSAQQCFDRYVLESRDVVAK